MLNIVLYSLLIMLSSLVGVFSVWHKMGRVIERNLHFLVSFSAGVFLIVSLQLSKEVFEHAETIGAGLFWVVAGAVVIFLFFKLFPFFHHHHDEFEEHSHSKIDARRILLSDSLHNIGDGIFLAASFGVSMGLGVATAVSIFVHELFQEMSEFFVLRQAGYSTKKALGLSFLVSATILIGALGSFFLLDFFEVLEVPLLGIASGSFFIVVAHDLIPHAFMTPTFKKDYLRHVGWFLAGLVLMIGLSFLISH
ncbi:MAG: hypothetical protein A3H57_02775 [Candidatus Taylorbacteria bacterium RIFCSPLOWO2_02_FULL_43_11]|uniref:ZIP family metal transporter n=1 Tax=Candidatus Taylorbacteria bacterium RIFCSPHIGHO2_02_FULL_43_32b TaxID=1802306 RepID=A0A1G2MGQ1_9BACT|nr:MAG: hypothetical protein A3C72_04695 [Candidatus Taylorbacteria bacterium RIFCSPHIGHO2_02_FULL_43_32b]OHA36356.1 MAG: hypothetical protein A3H57_02775 [Candidatus Taylorbacteria bacterium RIFCSPLOWO2_02_FULL_43_11]